MTRKISNEKIREIREVYLKGNTIKKTAEITNVYYLTAFKYVKNISRGNKRRIPHNKGKTKENYEPLKIVSEKRKGIQFSEKHIKNLSKSHKGQKGYWKDKKMTQERRKRFLKYWNSLKYKVREKHHNWKGNRELRKLIRDGYMNINWRTNVFKRDNFICQHCGYRGKGLIAHHIKPFAKILEEYKITTLEEADNCKELWDINNGITLCKRCHTKEHKRVKKDEK